MMTFVEKEKLSKKEIKEFQKKILGWYRKNKRDLPWRHARDAYKILISEVMSQQTQISRVVPKYLEWMKTFPDVESLAKASTRDALLYWSGLGYNRRALYLKRVAELLCEEPKAPKGPNEPKVRWPETEEELMKLPGIGKYTARAILCFAFNKQVAVVDTNVRKVILTEFQMSNFKSQILNEKEIEEIAEMLLPKGKAYEWNQALMDYAALLRPVKLGYGRVKQNKFKDSDRYYRGHTIRLLLKKNNQTFEDLWKHMRENNEIDKERYKRILEKLVKEGIVKNSNSTYLLY